MLLGKDNIKKLNNSHVAVFGVGGVGSYVCEALARCGVGKLDLIDNDTVSPSNINRQLVALNSTVGLYKVDVMKQRILDINENAQVNVFKTFFLPDNSDEFNFSQYDYVVDAVDTVAAKVELAVKCSRTNTPVISSMGTGNKLHPEMFEISDIFKTSVCPLAKAMRTRLKAEGIKKLKVVYSKEEPIKNSSGARIPASCSFTPPVAGMIIAGEVIKDILKL
ncbi:MAG: tRNA threonylcarbamoyladenosine dehydratase [Ruminococcaceae bacterium]|nr:tRNA threonylcarbamoyladenosine dehydratase [Oscillospiraceae bacterium]